MDKTVEYKGHSIAAETHKRGRGYQWSYQIDGGPIRTGNDRPLRREAIVLAEAIDEAKAAIDSMAD
jgi:hypothetical protein